MRDSSAPPVARVEVVTEERFGVQLADPYRWMEAEDEELAGREHSNLDWFVPSPDGRYVACGISQGGSESSTLRVLDADSGELLPDAIPGTRLGAVSWLWRPEGRVLLYHRYLDPPPGAPPHQRRRDSRTCVRGARR